MCRALYRNQVHLTRWLKGVGLLPELFGVDYCQRYHETGRDRLSFPVAFPALIHDREELKRASEPSRVYFLQTYFEHMKSVYPDVDPNIMLNRLQRTGFITDEMSWVEEVDSDNSLQLGSGNSFAFILHMTNLKELFCQVLIGKTQSETSWSRIRERSNTVGTGSSDRI